jgi:hypothetical protein
MDSEVVESGSEVDTGSKASFRDLDLADENLDSADRSLDSEEGLDSVDEDLDLKVSLNLEDSLDFDGDDY